MINGAKEGVTYFDKPLRTNVNGGYLFHQPNLDPLFISQLASHEPWRINLDDSNLHHISTRVYRYDLPSGPIVIKEMSASTKTVPKRSSQFQSSAIEIQLAIPTAQIRNVNELARKYPEAVENLQRTTNEQATKLEIEELFAYHFDLKTKKWTMIYRYYPLVDFSKISDGKRREIWQKIDLSRAVLKLAGLHAFDHGDRVQFLVVEDYTVDEGFRLVVSDPEYWYFTS